MLPRHQAAPEEVAGFFSDLMDSAKMTDQERQKFLDDLRNAVTLNFIARLSKKLSPKDRESMEAQELEDPEARADFLKKHISEKEMKIAMVSASEEVMRRFLRKITTD